MSIVGVFLLVFGISVDIKELDNKLKILIFLRVIILHLIIFIVKSYEFNIGAEF